MEIKNLSGKLQSFAGKYRYVLLVLMIGIGLMLLPGKKTQTKQTEISTPSVTEEKALESETLAEILQTIEGAGRVRVLLSKATGAQTVYQTDRDISGDGGTKTETVLITDSQRSQAGLIQQVNPPTYLGAIVVCEGADSSAVRLAITQAVAKITGLGTDAICVLKMK